MTEVMYPIISRYTSVDAGWTADPTAFRYTNPDLCDGSNHGTQARCRAKSKYFPTGGDESILFTLKSKKLWTGRDCLQSTVACMLVPRTVLKPFLILETCSFDASRKLTAKTSSN